MNLTSRRNVIKLMICLPSVAFAENTPFFLKGDTLLDVILKAGSDGAGSFQELGRLYLQSVETPWTFYALQREFKRHINYREPMDFDELMHLISRKVSEDFEENRIVNCQGWRFSRTEAYLGALTLLA